MKFSDSERREYREYADAAEWFFDQGDRPMAAEALRDAVRAAGFDDSVLSAQDLLWVLEECRKSDLGFGPCRLPADPWFLRVIVRRMTGGCYGGKILSKRKEALA